MCTRLPELEIKMSYVRCKQFFIGFVCTTVYVFLKEINFNQYTIMVYVWIRNNIASIISFNSS